MPRQSDRIEILTSQEITRGLCLLDKAIGNSELLMSVAPLRFITYGGMLAVAVFCNRQSTKDVDVLLEPNVDDAEEYRSELLRVVGEVTEEANYEPGWFNDELRLFIHREKRQQLFFDSIEQQIIAFQGANLIIYAGSLDFGLERKLRRLQERGGSIRSLRNSKDASDAVALLHQMKGGSVHPLSLGYVQNLNRNGFELPITQRIIDMVADLYREVYGSQGIVEMVWDEEQSKYKYLNLEGTWVWYE